MPKNAFPNSGFPVPTEPFSLMAAASIISAASRLPPAACSMCGQALCTKLARLLLSIGPPAAAAAPPRLVGGAAADEVADGPELVVQDGPTDVPPPGSPKPLDGWGSSGYGRLTRSCARCCESGVWSGSDGGAGTTPGSAVPLNGDGNAPRPDDKRDPSPDAKPLIVSCDD